MVMQFVDGDVLFDSSSVAFHEDCCCVEGPDSDCCTGGLPPEWSIDFGLSLTAEDVDCNECLIFNDPIVISNPVATSPTLWNWFASGGDEDCPWDVTFGWHCDFPTGGNLNLSVSVRLGEAGDRSTAFWRDIVSITGSGADACSSYLTNDTLTLPYETGLDFDHCNNWPSSGNIVLTALW